MIDVYRTTPADLRRMALEKGRVGYVGASDGTNTGQVHWTKAGNRKGKLNNEAPGESATAEQRLIERLFQGLPAMRRRSHQERFRSIFDRLATQALDSYRRVGYVAWPTSIQTELKELAWKTGDPSLTGYGGEDHVYKQVEALTRMYIEKASNKQKETDQKKVVLDWHGHYAT